MSKLLDKIRRFFRKEKPVHEPANIGTGAFRVIQNVNGSCGYISLIIHDTNVVAQKFVTDNDLYNELFDLIVFKLGGRIPEEDESNE